MVNRLSLFKTQTRFSACKAVTAMLCFLCLSISTTALAKLTVSVDRNPVAENDLVTITIESDESIQGSPDLSPLEKDFTIHSKSNHNSSSSFSFSFNGGKSQIKRSVSQQVVVSPKRVGKLEIPVIHWDGQQTQPYALSVNKADEAGTQRDFYVEISLDKNEAYVQEQLVLTIKAYANKQFARGQFETPKIQPAQMNTAVKLTQISNQDDVYTATVNGIHYQVQERKYVVIPERSGEITIDPVVFAAQFPTSRRRGADPLLDFGFGLNRGQVRRSQSNALALTVKPIPDTAKRPWIAARQLALSYLLDDSTPFKVGEPINLTLSTIAEGVLGESLPDLKLAIPDGLKDYPDQPETNVRWSGDSLIANRKDKLALIPTRAGDYTIPALTLYWWNTNTDQQEKVEIGPIKLSVEQGDAPVIAPPSSAQTQAQPTTDASTRTPGSETPLSQPVVQTIGVPAYWRTASFIFAGLWVLSCGYILYMRRQKPVASGKQVSQSRETLSKQALIDALAQASPQQARTLLLRWIQTEVAPQAMQISEAYPLVSEALLAALKQLDDALYSARTSDWDKEKAVLIKALNDYQIAEANNPYTPSLPPLYK